MNSYQLPRTATRPFCPSEVMDTVPVSAGATAWQRFRRYSGVGYLVAVGYMDPGNWATDIEAGSRFGYQLLWVVLMASLIAMLLQSLCVRMGVATGRDLAQLCRERFHPKVNFLLWLFAEIAIIATDFAEVLGTALALKLLFGLPLDIGILLTALDTVVILVMQGWGFLRVEAVVLGLVTVISVAFAIEIYISEPEWANVAKGLIPSLGPLETSTGMMLAIGIFGATVMPHNLYLHSSAVGTRKLAPTEEAKTDGIRLMTYDTIITLTIAFFVNAAILILAGTAFHLYGHEEVREINDAYYLLAPILGTALASILFALALFASGQSSTLTGTIASQVIFQGFLNINLPCWQQRLITRSLAIVPAWIGITLLGEDGLGRLLVISQVTLCMQLPFAVIPLILFNSNTELMGKWRLSRPMQAFCWMISLGIISANLFLLYNIMTGN